VLDAWAASPSRFREDANAEADAVTGGYRDRLVVELAQNAVDAGGSRLWLRLEGDVLLAANDGARLSADGVLGLSTLRASAKRSGQTVGRYGVGFAAVLAVSDAPEIGSRGLASVQWSAERSRELAAQVVGPELAARGGHVPILRLPFEGPPLDVPAGYDTLVRLPLRDPALARRLLEEFDPTLPLVLPGLLELRVGDREIRCQREGSVVVLDGVRWASASLHGVATPELMVGRPPEERPEWTVTAYAPISSTLPTPQALRAPTPTDEPLSLPVVLAATVPLEPTRRRLVPGPLAEHVLAAGGAAIAALLPTLDDPLPLIPTGLAAGAVDASVRTALLAALPGTAVLAGSAVLDLGPATEAVTALLAGTVAGLLPPSVLRHPAALSVLGIRRLTTADVVDLLAQSARSPAQWREVYSALADAPDRDALGALPVPLADGRVVTGCRGALLPDGPLPPEVAGLPLRVVHPQAAHPLLERLGAVPATAAGLLEDPALRAACEEAEDYDESLARGVCALVEAAGAAPAWVGETLLLPAERGAEVAGDLLWPGGLLDRAGADLPRLDPPAWLEERTARAAGVLDAPTVLTAEPPADWPFEVRPAETTLLSDLDLAEDLPALLAGLAADRELRSALLSAPYSCWWLGEHGALGQRAAELALPGDLDGLYDPPLGLDRPLLVALGVRTCLEDVLADAEATGDLLDRVGDAERTVGGARARAVYAAAAAAWSGRDDAPDPPLAVRGASGEVAPSARAVVVDAPDLLPLLRGRLPVVVGTAAARDVAELLDLDLLSQTAGPLEHDGVDTVVPPDLFALLVAAPARYRRCTRLTVEGVALPWRWAGGALYATEPGLPAGLAWAAGEWGARHLLAAAPADRARLALEHALD
jgi:hypothetical protein